VKMRESGECCSGAQTVGLESKRPAVIHHSWLSG